MKILLVTDAWAPHAHGAVQSLAELARQLQADGHAVTVIHPGLFRHSAAPGWLGMDLAWLPGRRLAALIEAEAPDALHIATEGPLGWAARRICGQRGLAFTSQWDGGIAERLRRRIGRAAGWLRRPLLGFHAAAARVSVSSLHELQWLQEQGLSNARLWTPGVDTRLFVPREGAARHARLGPLAHPVSLYVGTVALDRHIEDFLRLDVPGSKLVCGTGPDKQALRQRYPNVHWLGFLPRAELARIYAAADVLVQPSRESTPSAVVLEALACGTPVAARPDDAMVQLIGQGRGAALDDDLRQAWHEALRIPRHEARAQAMRFAWPKAAARFVQALQPAARAGTATDRAWVQEHPKARVSVE